MAPPLLLGDLLGGVPSDVQHGAPPHPPCLLGDLLGGALPGALCSLPLAPLVAAALIVSALVLLLYLAARPAIPEAERRAVRWLLLGSLFAIIAAAGGLPGSRLLLLPSVGGAALIATILRHGLRGVAESRSGAVRRALRRLGWVAVALVHVVIAPLILGLMPFSFMSLGRKVEGIARAAEIVAPLPKRVFVLAASDPSLCLLAWQGGRLRRVAPPEVGASTELPWEPGPTESF